jgi:histidinol-phosphate aminotransferase
MYGVLAKINDVENIKVLLDREFQIDTFEILEKMTKRSKLIFICSPNNPTGNLMDKESIKLILDNFDGLVIIDEAYIDFSKSDSWLKEIDNYNNLIVIQTFSKAYGMAGIRLGVCYANKQIIEILNKIKPPYNINQLSQNKAIEALEDLDKIKTQIADIEVSKELLLQELSEVKFVKSIYPSNSNFILIKVDDANKRYNQLLKNGVVVRNRNKEALCTNCLRITIGTQVEGQELIKILKNMAS